VAPAESASTVGADENFEDILDSHDGLRDTECAPFGEWVEACAGCPVLFAGEDEDVDCAGVGLERLWGVDSHGPFARPSIIDGSWWSVSCARHGAGRVLS
jgi:hypothetical protein